MALDLNRGVMTKFHSNGMKVSMYLDDPGTYLDDRGEKLDPKLATQAGFDVEKDRKKKVAQIKLAQYKDQLEKEMASEEEALARVLSQNGGHDVRHIGGGQFAVFDSRNKKVMTGTREEVEILIGPLPQAPAGVEHAPTSGGAA
jgi:hypothetical protein